jgi:Zn-dependent protease with chaperone function
MCSFGKCKSKVLGLVLVVTFVVIPNPIPGQGKTEKLQGYAEWRKGGVLIVDGQRVRADDHTKFKGKNISRLDSIPLGYEVSVKGRRQSDGTVLAESIEAKPNGMAMMEGDVLAASNQIERVWVQNGMMFEPRQDGGKQNIGRIIESGPQVTRVRRILARLAPPYVKPASLRVRVVETREWNASAMGNGAIWVYSGLLRDMSDDELAVILGHELAHYTHEHSRRNAKKAMIGQMVGAGAGIALSQVGGAKGQVAALGAALGLTAWMSGYSRDLEDQADRVGLRYAYEGGFNISRAPQMWARFRDKYGEQNSVTNFFVGSHSRPSDRIKNINRELELNYRDAPKPKPRKSR